MLIDKMASRELSNVTAPSWVSDKNLSGRVWTSLLAIAKEKQALIDGIKDRRIPPPKKVYQITKREIAIRAGCSPSSLHNRAFSYELTNHLGEVNAELKTQLDARVGKLTKVGKKDRKKSEILADLRTATSELKAAKRQNAKELVDEVFARLPLRTRRTLMLD
jgi:hypothetical protein